MRKNLLTSVTSPETPAAEVSVRSDYARRGASRSMMMSIDEMAENAKKVIAGETIVSLDPDLVDPSFVRDRVDEEEADFAVFRQGISERGQLQPILVRPHPDRPGRFMIVFGHRRVRAARELGLPVRAVVKEIEVINHIIAQGQENSRRADLTFIERSLLARKLMEMSQSKDTIKAALTIDDTTLSRMLSVVETIPLALIEAIGSARGVGRDRWEALKKIVAHPRKAELVLQAASSEEFRRLEAAARFDFVLARAGKALRKTSKPVSASAPISDEKGIAIAELRASKHAVQLKLYKPAGVEFGRFLEQRLPALFDEFRHTTNQE
jgi:ParB family transcriptional regulator, chromosome partitioning protein